MIYHSKSYHDRLDIDAVQDTIRSGCTAAGRLNFELTSFLEKYLKSDHVSLHSSGANAFYHILKALDLGGQDEVLVPNYICDSIARAVKLSGAKLAFYDNAENSWSSSIRMIENSLSRQTKVILINHTFGIRFFDYDDLDKLQIPIVEDCCHAFSNEIGGKEIGSKSIASFYSFNSTKFLAAGEGGAVSTNDEYLKKAIEAQLLDQGMSDLSCSLALEQLKKLNYFKDRRKALAETFFEKLADMTSDLRQFDSLFFRFPVFVKNQADYLESDTVAYRLGVDTLLTETSFAPTNHNAMPNSLRVKNKTISIPFYPALREKEVETIVQDFLTRCN